MSTLHDLPEAIAPLTEMPNWVVWRWEEVKGKRTKVPYQPRRPKAKAKNNDPETWGSYSEALAAFDAGGVSGIGFCLLNSDIAAFDIDHCRNAETGTIDPWAQTLVDRVGSYAEVTVSGTGLRIIGRGVGEPEHRKQPAVNGITLETYRGAARYIVMTGDQLGQAPLANIDAHTTR